MKWICDRRWRSGEAEENPASAVITTSAHPRNCIASMSVDRFSRTKENAVLLAKSPSLYEKEESINSVAAF